MMNETIVPVFRFLQQVDLKKNASRGRNKLLKRLEEKSTEYNDALREIRLEYFKVDEDGEFVKETDGTLSYIDKTKKKEAEERTAEVNKETFEIHFGEHSTKYDAMFEAILEKEEEMSGEIAFGYDELLEAYEANDHVDKEEPEPEAEPEAETKKAKKGTKK